MKLSPQFTQGWDNPVDNSRDPAADLGGFRSAHAALHAATAQSVIIRATQPLTNPLHVGPNT